MCINSTVHQASRYFSFFFGLKLDKVLLIFSLKIPVYSLLKNFGINRSLVKHLIVANIILSRQLFSSVGRVYDLY